MNAQVRRGSGHAGEPRSAAEIVAALDEVPPVAPVALQILRMSEDEKVSAADLARVISRDQVLTARVLRTCNSSYYGIAHEVASVSQAVVVLGLRAVRNLVLFHSLPVGRSGQVTDTEERLWTHSVGGALAGRLLAMRTTGIDPDQAFLSGLFHDLGRFLLNLARPGTYAKLCAASPNGRPAPELERAALGVDHMEIGAHALLRWEMGPRLAEVARRHHETGEGLPPAVAIVQRADAILARLDEDAEEGTDDDGEVLERLRESLEQEKEFFRQAA